jgi:hypothetical protein|tara:strand:- start:1350 stop:1739 length:390 start_codon:yes stop_codon:yes gene_type:complete
MNYIIYDSDGKISRVGSCSADNWDLISVSSGETLMEGTADFITQKVVNGVIVSKSDSELAAINNENLIALYRKDRDIQLQASDWTQLPNCPLTDTKKSEWATFRQALRDLPAHSNWPNLVDGDWPDEPT